MSENSDLKNAFVFVRDVYRNCVRILLSTDILIEGRGLFSKYNWNHIHDTDPIENGWRTVKMNNLTQADCLLTGFMFHQYFQRDCCPENSDIITLYTAPWRRVKHEVFRPACGITRFKAKSSPDPVYWIGVMPIWDELNSIDGNKKEYDYNSGMLSENSRQKYKEIVSDEKKLIGISVPLNEIISSADVENKLLKPLLDDSF